MRVEIGPEHQNDPQPHQPTGWEIARRIVTHPVVATVLLFGLAGGAVYGGSGLFESRNEQGTIAPAATTTPKPSDAAGSPSPTPTNTERPTPSASPKVETQQTAEIPLMRFADIEEVARRFGADDYSKKASNWELAENGTAAVLKPDTSDNGGYPLSDPNLHWGIEHLVNLNGGVAQGYDKIKRTADGLETFQGNKVLNAQAQAEVTHPSVKQAYYAKVTIRSPQNAADLDALYRKLKDDQTKLEVEFQPGTLTLPENECPPGEPARNVPVRAFASTQEAANLFGGDDYTRRASSWTLVENNTAAVLTPDSSDSQKWGIEHRVKTSGAVVQGYNKIKRDATGIESIQGNIVNNAQAEAKVINPSVPEADLMAGTFRIATNSADTEALFRKLLADQKTLETQQPFTPTIPVNECPTPGGKGATGTITPTQGPSIKGGGEPVPTPTSTPTATAYLQRG